MLSDAIESGDLVVVASMLARGAPVTQAIKERVVSSGQPELERVFADSGQRLSEHPISVADSATLRRIESLWQTDLV
jgi:hypothetical protein